MKHPVSFFQIQGGEPRTLIKFYRKTFGWKGSAAPDGGLMVDSELGGIPGAVGPSSDGSAHLAVYITVDNVTRHLTRAQKAGARIAMPETQLPSNLGSIGGMIDPAGNWVGLWAPTVAATTRARARKKSPKKKLAAKKASRPAAPAKRPRRRTAR